MKKTILRLSLLLALVMLLACGCQSPATQNAAMPEVQPKTMIIDTDAGGDDAAAIMMAALQPEINLLGITVVSGNVPLEQGAKNALMSLEIAGRTDVPVYCGSSDSIAGVEYEIFSVYGKDGMGDAGLVHPSNTHEEEYAVDFILNAIKEAPYQVEIVALGPVTNVALAIRQDPETMQKVKHIWIMGTSGFGPGNATPVAEFNAFKDPDALKILFDSGLPITVIGLDTNVESTYITREDQTALVRGNELEYFIGTALNGLMQFNQTAIGQDIATLPDPIAMACVLWSDYALASVPCHASVITDPGETYGQVLFYKEGHGYDVSFSFDNYNVSVVTETRSDLFKTWFMQTLKNGMP
jgi:purine nucleosidase